jgi:hypothetical protein
MYRKLPLKRNQYTLTFLEQVMRSLAIILDLGNRPIQRKDMQRYLAVYAKKKTIDENRNDSRCYFSSRSKSRK